MKKLIAFLAISATLFSCSNDDDSTKEFFNLKEGNLWVYKRYNQLSENGPYQFSGLTDSVKVVGEEIKDGLSYFKISHKEYQGPNLRYEWDRLQRIDESGHLVNYGGLVEHPGTDVEYNSTIPFTIGGQILGNIAYKLMPLKDVVVDNKNYPAYLHEGYYMPLEKGGISGIVNQIYYTSGVGMVLTRTRYLHINVYIEDRLVSYPLD